MSQEQDDLITKKVKLLRKDPQKAREEHFSDMTDREFDRMFKYIHQYTEDFSGPVKDIISKEDKEEIKRLKESFKGSGKTGRLIEIARENLKNRKIIN